ncbi:hypothetical protein BaRGS_00035312 [Batillaria attramentaria]|uniref:Uncharacterized protein n=1 Tax=Batillaria attramentaria TaxID=370345 RepID=A0ABD0JF33_9CAEN
MKRQRHCYKTAIPAEGSYPYVTGSRRRQSRQKIFKPAGQADSFPVRSSIDSPKPLSAQQATEGIAPSSEQTATQMRRDRNKTRSVARAEGGCQPDYQ